MDLQDQLHWCRTPVQPIDPGQEIYRGITANTGWLTLIILSTAKRDGASFREVLSKPRHPAILAWLDYDNLADAMEMLCHYGIVYPEHLPICHYSDIVAKKYNLT